MFDIFRDADSIDFEKYVVVTYILESTHSVRKAAFDLAIGQSVGNPNIRNEWETDELFENHACLVLRTDLPNHNTGRMKVQIAFPVINTDWEGDGIAHLMCQILGGQVDIPHIIHCRVESLWIPDSVRKHFLKPRYGLKGIREYTGQFSKPIFGGIIKPKTGLRPNQLLDMVKELVDGGVDFIKEDEILSNPSFCRLDDRVGVISKYLHTCGRKVVYCYSINCDPHAMLNRCRFLAEEGANGVHINFWSGLGAYRAIRQLDLPLFLHYQKSGDKVLTHKDNAFSLSWYAMCQLAALAGVDSIHAGMFGGYMSEDTVELKSVMRLLHYWNVLPALSCGMHPGLVNHVTKNVGTDYMANVGGALHGHFGGTVDGCKAMRQAIDKNFGNQYYEAIEQWGLVNE
jgi:ribulose 1,5-bisphosphate carboxylase large subunit-like protein